MHEISLVQGLFQQLDELARENNAGKVTRVTMEIGPLSGVVVDSFRFGFEILVKEYPLMQEAELVIDITPVSYRCTHCAFVLESTSAQRPSACPKCDELLLIPSGGDDLILKRVEME